MKTIELTDEIHQGDDEEPVAWLVLNHPDLHINGLVPEYDIFIKEIDARHHAESNSARQLGVKPWSIYPLYAGKAIEVEI